MGTTAVSLTGGPIASMTGYGRAEARGARSAVTVEIRSLNHRFLEIGLKLGRGLSAHEPELRRLVQGRVTRGRLDLAVANRRVGGGASVVRTDRALAAEYLAGARALEHALGVPVALTAGDLLRLPGVVTVEEAEEDESEIGVLLKDATEQALEELVRMRQAEGATLAAELRAHLDALDAWTREVAAILPAALARVQERVRTRVRSLLGELPVDAARVAQEAALWAAKTDVAEELARLGSHCGQFRALLGTGGAVGRQLEFLTQEMHREVNTIGSKADDGEMIARLLDGRTVVERLREQVQNVE